MCNRRIKKGVGNPIAVPIIPGLMVYVRIRHGLSVQTLRTVNRQQQYDHG